MSEPHIIGSRSSYAVWRADGIYGMSVWGPHAGTDAGQFYRDCTTNLELGDEPCDHVADMHLTRLGDHDWRSVSDGLRWARTHRELIIARTRRWVAVPPNTAMGWAIVGSQRMMGMPYPSMAARSIDVALERLGRADRATLGPWLEGLPERARSQNADIQQLRDLLMRRPDVGLGDAARALGVSGRSLQRMLAAHGTTFRGEQMRIRAACSTS